MSASNKSQPAEPQEQAANKGVATELNSEAIENLTGFFDILIQMDLAKQIKERNYDGRNRKISEEHKSSAGQALLGNTVRRNKKRNSKGKSVKSHKK